MFHFRVHWEVLLDRQIRIEMNYTVLVIENRGMTGTIVQNAGEGSTTITMIVGDPEADSEAGSEAVDGVMGGVGGKTATDSETEIGVHPAERDEVDLEALQVDMELGET
jgi:hypothetical protein